MLNGIGNQSGVGGVSLRSQASCTKPDCRCWWAEVGCRDCDEWTSQWRRQGEGGKLPPLWVDVQNLCNMCAFIVMELLRITWQIHCKAVEQRATLMHRQYNRDWGTSYSRPPIDPYLTSPLLQNPGGTTGTGWDGSAADRQCDEIDRRVNKHLTACVSVESHSVTCHPAEVTFPPLSQPKLVLD